MPKAHKTKLRFTPGSVEAKPAAAEEPDEAAEVEVSPDEIAQLAYSLWEARGRPEGSADEDWLQAESKLKKRRAAAAG